jgi:hypothetical protein
VAADNVCQRPNGDKLGDLPIIWDQLSDWSYAGKHDHHGNHGDTPDEGYLELLNDGWNFLEKGGIGCFFGGGAPGHIYAKKMAEDGLGDVDGDAAEKRS